jgi:glycolate oxidase subunit GlcD
MTISKELIQELRRIVGARHVFESRTAAELYSYDGSLAKGPPGAVVFPADARETALSVKAAAGAGVPFVPRGFGTNLSGGTVLPSGGLTICLTRLNRILGIHPERRTAVVQPGVTNLELQNALAPLGFFYAPDPASQKVATLGGNVGENSGGPRCLKYGVTTNHILGLEVVLADGEMLRIGGPALDPPGIDLRGVLVGSEGTLAVVTEVTVRIMPRAESVITQLAVYDDVAAAARSVADIIAAGIVPATLEMMDAPIIRAVEDSAPCGYPRDAAAVLIIEVEGPRAGLAGQAGRIRAICMGNRCREVREAADAAERNRLWEGRRGAFGAVARLAPNYLVNDCTVPRNRLPEALAQVDAIVKKHGFAHGNVFHAGDGNLHPLILFDSRDPGQLERVHEVGWEIMEACTALGGTISGEHGIGVEKMEAMRLVFSEADIAAQRALKEAFDPAKRVNPGKIFAEPDPAGHGPRHAAFAPDAATVASAAEQAVVATVKEALATGGALRPTGGGSQAGLGNILSRAAAVLSTAALGAMIELDPANQVFTAGAGMRLGAVQSALAAHNQWLPLRPPPALLERTLGGVAASGACGPERLVFGAPRDLMLGLRFVDGRGRLISAGGKVVKNVAGYDMTRLLVGSAGTLGVITRVTMRMATRPGRCTEVSACGALKLCAQAAAQALGSSLGAVFAAAEPEGREGRFRLRLGFEGFEETVAAQAAQAEALLRQAGLTDPEAAPYDLLTGPFAAGYRRIAAHPFVLRAVVPADRAASAAGWVGWPPPAALVDFGCGAVLAGLPGLSAADWERIGRAAAEAGGHAVLEAAPDGFRGAHDVFGPSRPEWGLSHRIKDALDPDRVFSPGAMPGRV